MSCIVVRNRHGNLAFRIYWNGIESWEGTKGLKDTAENRQLMEARAMLIAKEIEVGSFDYLKWFPHGNKAKLFRQEKAKAEPQTIRQYYEMWKVDKIPPFVKKTRARNYRSHFDAHILPEHGEKYMHLYSFTDIRELRTRLVDGKKRTMKTAKNVIDATLRAVFRDARAEGIIDRNPFDDVPKRWWPKIAKPDPEPFTEGERDEILAYLKRKHWRGYGHRAMRLFWGCSGPDAGRLSLPPDAGVITIRGPGNWRLRVLAPKGKREHRKPKRAPGR